MADIATSILEVGSNRLILQDAEARTKINDMYITDTASGAIASFPDGANDIPVKSLTVNIEPVQSGSGDPSPTNIRPITGHTSAVVTVSPTTDAQDGTSYTIDLDGTRYGGSLDVGTGVLTVDRKYRLLNGVNGDGVTYDQNGHTAISTRAFVRISDKAYGVDNAIASSFHFVAAGDIVGMMIGRAGNNGIEFYLDPSVPNTADGVKAWFADNPTDLVYELAEPFTVQLTPQEVTTLKGQNNIWSDAGDVEVEYRADTKLYINKVLNA